MNQYQAGYIPTNTAKSANVCDQRCALYPNVSPNTLVFVFGVCIAEADALPDTFLGADVRERKTWFGDDQVGGDKYPV